MLERFRELATVRQALEQARRTLHMARAAKEAGAADEHTLIRWARQTHRKTRG
jgi:hypothetical protein